MSKLVATTIQTKDGATDLTASTGNTTGPQILVQAAGGYINLMSNSTTTAAFANASGLYGTLHSMQVFTANGTWTKPTGCTKVKVTVLGGGGGGGQIPSGGAPVGGAGGGGGGGFAIKFVNVAAISSQTVTIGLGGTGATSGAAAVTGGTSSFGSQVSATGGVGGANGTNAANTAGGAGGAGSSGDINWTGETGGAGIASYGGRGGGSMFGGGAPQIVLIGSLNAAGTNAVSYGGGGSGAVNSTGGGGVQINGGNGNGGIIIVEEYY